VGWGGLVGWVGGGVGGVVGVGWLVGRVGWLVAGSVQLGVGWWRRLIEGDGVK